MKGIILIALFLLAISGLAVYFGVVKIIVPENIFGRTDKISSDNFKFVGKVNLLGNQQISDLKNYSTKSASSKTSSQSVKKTNIISMVAQTASPLLPLTATSTAILTATSAVVLVELSEPIIPSIISQTSLNSNTIINIGISEILVGIDGNADYEFIELYNPNEIEIDLTGYSIKKRSSTGSESTLISASRFEGRKIMPKKYFLLANEGGYNGVVQSDIVWPKSYILAYKNNAVIFYNANGEAIEDIGWDEIVKGQSLERVFLDNASWNNGEFKVQNNPNPKNSQF